MKSNGVVAEALDDEYTPPSMADVSALRAANLPRLSWTALFTINEGAQTAEDVAALYDYFARFLPPDPDMRCVGCKRVLSGSPVHQAFGMATFTWGIAHGEGYCRQCQYPGRALHYDVGPIKSLNFVLQYHPDDVRTRDER